ncbi:MAG TPA: type II toxin-antitoxin system RelE/ParE family toxin [Spirochaetota bacterium]|jgi:mRNA interferase RelE/StbE|nr:type II toxin-antitoxin system RelE/ParE family toxin [Spirochaetota bacterium]HOH36563.1 type II toxin-antitoxin system RelE/ParE family toxin [Spirochaetota bacterium]HPJ13554.1 type II toxin-antitoxin system RelE/ParE family toxin [Spirochaetota bacterium]HPM33299.1 type II toxin-antitoxin system RelE/ParE family toxin [Spirochaetota bacterium]HPY02541.1 type II toxin-antitoxin system RelE/ParE family toxin [Spirochaetota bacterium]
MIFRIVFSKEADKFLEKNPKIEPGIVLEIKKIIRKQKGETVSISIKNLTGKWKGYSRLRKGKVRIIFKLDLENNYIFIDSIDFRGDVYK